MNTLWPIFLADDHKPTMKWVHYIPVYERYMGKFVNQPVRMLELGVWKGGSLQMWKRYLGPLATITGIDVDKQYMMEEHQIKTYLGYQEDPAFLTQVNDQRGPFDIILDDCSHIAWEAIASFEFFYPRMSENGVYIIEDTNGFYDDPRFVGAVADKIQELNCWFKTKAPTGFTKTTMAIHHHEFMVIFERGRHEKPEIIETGKV